jgi:hypothetical protein
MGVKNNGGPLKRPAASPGTRREGIRCLRARGMEPHANLKIILYGGD